MASEVERGTGEWVQVPCLSWYWYSGWKGDGREMGDFKFMIWYGMVFGNG